LDSLHTTDFGVLPNGVSTESFLRAKAICGEGSSFRLVTGRINCELELAVSKLMAIFIRAQCQNRADWARGYFQAGNLNAVVSGWDWTGVFPWLPLATLEELLISASQVALELCASDDNSWFLADEIATFWSQFTALPQDNDTQAIAARILSESTLDVSSAPSGPSHGNLCYIIHISVIDAAASSAEKVADSMDTGSQHQNVRKRKKRRRQKGKKDETIWKHS
jgi:hypothetical protein